MPRPCQREAWHGHAARAGGAPARHIFYTVSLLEFPWAHVASGDSFFAFGDSILLLLLSLPSVSAIGITSCCPYQLAFCLDLHSSNHSCSQRKGLWLLGFLGFSCLSLMMFTSLLRGDAACLSRGVRSACHMLRQEEKELLVGLSRE